MGYWELGYNQNLLRQEPQIPEAVLSEKMSNADVSGNIPDNSIEYSQTTFNTFEPDEDMQTSNFVSGSAGWRIKGNGDVEFNEGTFRGSLTAGSVHIPDQTTANSMHVETDGDTYWGCNVADWASDNDNANAYILKTGEAKFQNVTISASSLPGLPGDENLAGYWSFDEGQGSVVDDFSSNSNTGAITGASWVTGISGNALDFDGTDDVVLIADNSAIQDIFDSGGSVSAWIYVDSDGESDVGRIVDKRTVASAGWLFDVEEEASGAVNLGFYYEFSTTGGWWRTTGTPVTIGQWVHVVVTYDADAVGNNPIFYVDGASQTVTEASTPVGTRDTDAGVDLYIGDDDTSVACFDGKIDEVRLFDDVLTANEVGALSNNPSGTSQQGVKQLGGLYATAGSGARTLLFPDANTGIQCIDDSSNDVFKVIVGGSDVGDVILGDYDSSKGAKWDKSASAFLVKGTFTAQNASSTQTNSFNASLASGTSADSGNVDLNIGLTSTGNFIIKVGYTAYASDTTGAKWGGAKVIGWLFINQGTISQTYRNQHEINTQALPVALENLTPYVGSATAPSSYRDMGVADDKQYFNGTASTGTNSVVLFIDDPVISGANLRFPWTWGANTGNATGVFNIYALAYNIG